MSHDDNDPDVLESRRRKAEADAGFEQRLAEAREKLERHQILRELERRWKERG